MRSAIITAAAAGDALGRAAADRRVGEGSCWSNAGHRRPGPNARLASRYLSLYNFPHAGKILSLAFLPFAAWFAGGSLRLGNSDCSPLPVH